MKIGERVKALTFREELAGKVLGVTKKVLHWTFEADGVTHTLSLSYSVFSSKFVVSLDGRIIHEGTRGLISQFDFETSAGGYHFRVREGVFTFEFYINGVLFQPNTFLTPPPPPRHVTSARHLGHVHKMSFHEQSRPLHESSVVGNTGKFQRTETLTENQRLSNFPIPPLMKRKTDPIVENVHNEGAPPGFLSPKGVCSPQSPPEVWQQKGIRLHRQGHPPQQAQTGLIPSVQKSNWREGLQMPAIFTETNIKKAFRLPRGPPLIFDKFDPFETESERFAETDFDCRTSIEKKVLSSMF